LELFKSSALAFLEGLSLLFFAEVLFAL
jgi:hypothetical protein